MTVVSYRIYCEECSNERVIREEEETLWRISSIYQNSGVCPECNDMVSVEDIESSRESREDDSEAVEFETVDGIGSTTADALRCKGIRTRGDVRRSSDAKLLGVSGIGEGKVDSIRERVE